MIIVNQRRTTIINFANTEFITKNDNQSVIYARTNNAEIKLGEYKTEERTKEVLKDLMLRYEAIELYKTESTEKVSYVLAGYTPLYEMPKE